MKYLYLLLLLICTILSRLNAQHLSRKNLKIDLKTNKKAIYIVNGKVFLASDSLALDKELISIDILKISEVNIIRDSGKLSHPLDDAIIINYAIELPAKVVRKKLRKAKLRFKDKPIDNHKTATYELKNPILYLNSKKIDPSKCKIILNSLRKSEIGYIYSSQTPLNEDYFGKNAKNGVIRIWTKKRLKGN